MLCFLGDSTSVPKATVSSSPQDQFRSGLSLFSFWYRSYIARSTILSSDSDVGTGVHCPLLPNSPLAGCGEMAHITGLVPSRLRKKSVTSRVQIQERGYCSLKSDVPAEHGVLGHKLPPVLAARRNLAVSLSGCERKLDDETGSPQR
jgi:hypothetical protein